MNQDRFAIDGHKLYWHLERVAEWQKNRMIAPLYVEISPVSYCNHQCIFCGLDFAHNQQCLALDADVLMTRISEMGQLGVKSIMLAGEGEPLLHPRIAEIATHAKNCGIDVAITTNGMAGSSELWVKLLPVLTWIRFSIDAATPERYAQVHGVASTCFERTIASLKDALRVKYESGLLVTVGVQFLMIQQNLADIEAALHLYSDIGVDYLSFKPYSEHPQMLNKSGFTYSSDSIDTVERAIQNYTRSNNTKTAIIFRKEAVEAYAEGIQRFTSCCALPFWGYVSAKGDFYTCSVYLNDDRFNVGNIYNETIESIVLGKKREQSIDLAEHQLEIGHECRVNCRMARINEFLAFLNNKPDHVNFI